MKGTRVRKMFTSNKREELLVKALKENGYYFKDTDGVWCIYARTSSARNYMERQIAYKVRDDGFISVAALGATLINNTPVSSFEDIAQLNQEMLLNQSDRLDILKSIGDRVI